MEYPHGGDIYTYEGLLDFSANSNPFGPSEGVIEAIKDSAAQIGNYPDYKCRVLRKKLAAMENIKEEQLVFGNGAADLIFSLVLAEKPKKAILTAPSFSEYAQALQTIDCEMQYYYKREEAKFQIQEDYLRLLTEEIDIIFLCSPDNPTGQVVERSLLERIREKCRQKHIRMVLDQCFCEFQSSQEDVLACHEVKEDTTFLLRAFTKMHGIPGVRLGYGYCKDQELMERIQKIRQPWSVSTLAQAAGVAALQETERIERTRSHVEAERKWMEVQLKQMGVKSYPSYANYILIQSDNQLFQRLLEKRILIRDCSNYIGLRQGYYRIAIKTREENEQLMEALKAIEMCTEEEV